MWEPWILALFLALSFVFSGSEVAFFSAKAELRGGLAGFLAKRPFLLLGVILTGNTLVNSMGASVLVPWLLRLGLSHRVASLVEMVGFTGVLLVVSEITPKLLAMRKPQWFLRLSAPVVGFFWPLLLPIAWPLELAFGRFGGAPLRANLLDLRRAARRWGLGKLLREAAALISQPLEAAVSPLREEAFVPVSATVREARALLGGRNHLIVGDRRNPVGWLAPEDLEDMPPDARVAPLARPLGFLPSHIRLLRAAREMKRAGVRLACVVDEYGTVRGVVSPSLIAKRLLGGIREPTKRLWGGGYVLSGELELEDLEEVLGRELGDPDQDITGFLTQKLGRVPREGDRVDLGDAVVEVLRKEGEEIKSIRVDLK